MWEINYPYITNKKDMFRLDELYDEERDNQNYIDNEKEIEELLNLLEKMGY